MLSPSFSHILFFFFLLLFRFLFKIIIPAYYSLKFIKQRDSKLIGNILKFWCLNSVWTLFEYLIPLVVDQ